MLKLLILNKNYFKAFLLSVLLCNVAACSNDTGSTEKFPVLPVISAGDNNDWASIPLPDISHQPIRLRVANVVNPRFRQLSNFQIKKILIRSQQMVAQYFDVTIEFSGVKTLPIEDVFSRIDSQVVAERSNEIVDINSIDKQVREGMQQALFETLSNYTADRQNVIDYAQPYLLRPEIKTENFIDLSYVLVDTLISRLLYWKSQKADDAQPVLDENGYHQWVWWDSLGYSDLSYDILITNQLVASAEYYAMDVHSSLRGGITAGTTTYNKNTATKSYAYIMVYPMLNDSELLTTLRQDAHYSEQQIINYSAALLTHELGHLLLHLGHPFGNKSCIMSPTLMLNYRDWYEHFDAEKCASGSMAEMKPGAASINYNRRW